MRVVFAGGGTGGHLYPGLAIARALVRARADVRPYFVGAQRGIERDVLPQMEFEFTLLDAHPFYRQRPWESWKTMRGMVSGWRTMNALARKERPALVVGTGGYASAIPVMWARAHGIPVVQHIGDAFPGVAARTFARLSRECYLGFPEAQQRLPRSAHRYVVTGNPIEPPPSPRPSRSALLDQWAFAEGARVLLIFGGSQGSLALNEVVASWIKAGIPDGLSVIWATGTRTYDQFNLMESPRVRVVSYLSPIADAYGVSDIALVRGGMMGTAELCAWGVPMIIVPLPTAAADHQTWNARSLEEAGAAVHIPQRTLSWQTLHATVMELLADSSRLSSLRNGALLRARPDAAAEIAKRISALLPGTA